MESDQLVEPAEQRTSALSSVSNVEARCPSDGRWFSLSRQSCNLTHECDGTPAGSVFADYKSNACPIEYGNSSAIAAILAAAAREVPASGLSRFGYYAVRNGWLHMDTVGTDRIHGIWGGASQPELDGLLKRYSRSRPGITYVVFRCDSGDSLAELRAQDRRALANAGVVILVASLRRDVWRRLAPLVRVLPSPWTDDYKYAEPRNQQRAEARADIRSGAQTAWRRRNATCIWRGMTSGVYPLAEAKEKFGDAGLGPSVANLAGVRLAIVEALKDSPALADMGFTSVHTKSWPPQTLIKKRLSAAEQQAYQCVLVLDGWGWPGSLRGALLSGSVPLVASRIHVGYMSELQPYIHYIPLRTDGSDARQRVAEVLDKKNSDAMARVAQAAHKFASTQLSPMMMRMRLRRVMLAV